MSWYNDGSLRCDINMISLLKLFLDFFVSNLTLRSLSTSGLFSKESNSIGNTYTFRTQIFFSKQIYLSKLDIWHTLGQLFHWGDKLNLSAVQSIWEAQLLYLALQTALAAFDPILFSFSLYFYLFSASICTWVAGIANSSML